jgi:Do/DeqQ family serine protease
MMVKRFFASPKLFVFNLVFIGIVFGFSLALLSFSCSTKVQPAEKVLAQDANVEALKSLQSLQNSFRSVSDKVLPVVVMVNVVEIKKQGTPDRNNLPWFYYFFGQPDQENAPEREFRNRGLGSGVIVRKNGKSYYVLTNNHVVGTAEEINVQLHDRREFKAKLVGKDERKDLALLSFDGGNEEIPLAELGDSNSLHVGDWVLAVGNPFGLESTVTAGIVSALGRRGGPEGNISDFIQTDASINQGNSGGALVNLAGEVVGINTWITSPTGGSIGLGFAIPINNVKKAVEDLISSGSVQYGWLGVSISILSAEMAESLSLPDTKGAFVYHVFKGSPADKGGILPGDFITVLNGKKIVNSDELVLMVGDLPVGNKANFSMIRQGKPLDLTVTIMARQNQQSITEQSKNLWPGLTVIPVNDGIRKELEIPSSARGVVIQSVEPRTPGSLAGLKSGDFISEMNGKPVSGLLDFYGALNDKSRDKVEFVYERGGVKMSVGVFR